VPEGVVNDRWGVAHHDYITSEYQMNVEQESRGLFENNRGIGYSFGYNQVETKEHYMSVEQSVSHLVDVVSRGGNFLLNVGPMANGELPPIQLEILNGIASWMEVNGEAIHGSRPVPELKAIGKNDEGETPWLRFTGFEDRVYAFVKGDSSVEFELPTNFVQDNSQSTLGEPKVSIERSGNKIRIDLQKSGSKLPQVISFLRL
jgi:alpha-L-fucosidase